MPDHSSKRPPLHETKEVLHDVERFIEKGTREFFWANLSLFAAGFSTFALLYCVQPIMPLFSKEFDLSPAQASLSLSVTTQALAAAMLVAGALSEVFGRKLVMGISIIAASLLLIASAFAPNWESFLVLRFLAGLAFSGLPATAMAYIGEEMHADVAAMAMGLYRRHGTGSTGRAFDCKRHGRLDRLAKWTFYLGADLLGVRSHFLEKFTGFAPF